MVKYLRSRGVECFGIEPANAEPLAGIEGHVFPGTSAEGLAEGERGRFKTILLLDVIEHFSDPVGFLGRLEDLYPNLEFVLVTVPACPRLWTNYDEYNGHYRRYTPELMRRTADSLGWTLVRQSYFFRLLYPPIRLIAELGMERSLRIRAPVGPMRLVHEMLSRCLVVEYRLLPRGVPGSSIIALFRVVRADSPDGQPT
jgi:hypothetical protein